uniref:Uncharacterized protein n=1 Tax=Panagrolaimus davidi TaxID=227884 RepID=A0A914PLN9_9BILA
MSAEAIKEKPQHFSVISQSNIVSSSIKKMEPIHPKIGVPIIPVNHFQLLIPLSALKKENTLEAAKTTTKNVKHFKNGEENATTTVSPIL